MNRRRTIYPMCQPGYFGRHGDPVGSEPPGRSGLIDSADRHRVSAAAPGFIRSRWPRFTLTGWLSLGGVALAVLLLWRVGPAAVGHLLAAVGWSAVLLPLPYALMLLCDTSGWWHAFPGNGCPLRFLTLLRFNIAGKAIQSVTPSLSQAGELVKLHLLRRAGVRTDLATASIVMSKTTFGVAELAFVIVGLTSSLAWVTIEPAVARGAAAAVIVLAVALGGVLMWQRLGIFRPLVSLARRLDLFGEFLDRHESLLASTDAMVRDYLVRHPARFALAGLSCFATWMTGALETWVVLWLLGLPVPAAGALFIQTMVVVVNRLTAFVPGNLGTLEAATVMAFAVLGLPAEGALAFALLRRARQLGWFTVGLALLPRGHRGRAAVPSMERPNTIVS